MNIINYKPVSERIPDSQYNNLLREILNNGLIKRPIHGQLAENKGKGGQEAKEITGYMLKYDLRNGFPLLPIRNLRKPFYGAVGEVIAFANGARTLNDLERWGCPRIFWERWVSKDKCEAFGLPEGDLGGGSYGASLRNFPHQGKTFDQINSLIRGVIKAPHLRTHCITTWNPPLSKGDPMQGVNRDVVVAPCHGNFVHFVFFDEPRVMHMTHEQRSADAPVGLQFNIAQWCAFGMTIAAYAGYEFTQYTHFLSEPHIYDVQYEIVEKLLERELRPFPTVTLAGTPFAPNKPYSDVVQTDFMVEDYDPHPWITIPTPV